MGCQISNPILPISVGMPKAAKSLQSSLEDCFESAGVILPTPVVQVSILPTIIVLNAGSTQNQSKTGQAQVDRSSSPAYLQSERESNGSSVMPEYKHRNHLDTRLDSFAKIRILKNKPRTSLQGLNLVSPSKSDSSAFKRTDDDLFSQNIITATSTKNAVPHPYNLDEAHDTTDKTKFSQEPKVNKVTTNSITPISDNIERLPQNKYLNYQTSARRRIQSRDESILIAENYISPRKLKLEFNIEKRHRVSLSQTHQLSESLLGDSPEEPSFLATNNLRTSSKEVPGSPIFQPASPNSLLRNTSHQIHPMPDSPSMRHSSKVYNSSNYFESKQDYVSHVSPVKNGNSPLNSIKNAFIAPSFLFHFDEKDTVKPEMTGIQNQAFTLKKYKLIDETLQQTKVYIRSGRSKPLSRTSLKLLISNDFRVSPLSSKFQDRRNTISEALVQNQPIISSCHEMSGVINQLPKVSNSNNSIGVEVEAKASRHILEHSPSRFRILANKVM